MARKTETAPVENVNDGHPQHLSADEIEQLLEDTPNIKEREQRAIRLLSRQLEGLANKEAAAEMGTTQWKLYDIRVSALRKMMPLVGVEDIEEMYPLLDIKRGKKAPERHTQYFPRKNAEPAAEEQAEASDESEEDEDIYEDEDGNDEE